MVTTHDKLSYVPRSAKCEGLLQHWTSMSIRPGDSWCSCDQGHQTGFLSISDCSGRFCCRFGIKCSTAGLQSCHLTRTMHWASTKLEFWHSSTKLTFENMDIFWYILSQNLWFYTDRCRAMLLLQIRETRPISCQNKMKLWIINSSTDFKTELTKRGNCCNEKVKEDTPAFIPVFY